MQDSACLRLSCHQLGCLILAFSSLHLVVHNSANILHWQAAAEVGVYIAAEKAASMPTFKELFKMLNDAAFSMRIHAGDPIEIFQMWQMTGCGILLLLATTPDHKQFEAVV